MKKIETSLQTAPIIMDAIETPRETVRLYKAAGYDAVIVTNRYDADVLTRLKKLGNPIDVWLGAYSELKKFGQRAELDVWLGATVPISRLVSGELEQTDYVIYGIDEDFLRSNPRIYEYDFDKMYAAVKEAGAIVLQMGTSDIPATLADGVVITSDDYTRELEVQVEARGLILLCGSNFKMRGDEDKGATFADCKDYAGFLSAVKNNSTSVKKG